MEENDADDDMDLTPEEMAEKQYQDMVSISDKVMDRWREATPEPDQQAIVDRYAETGELNHEGIDAMEASVVQSAFALHAQREVFTPLGLTQAQYNSYVDPADLPALRRALVTGRWDVLREHAQRVASYIHQHGDTNAAD